MLYEGVNNMSEFAIQISGLTKSFPGVKALDNIDLNIPKGSIIGLLGPNGSGKSTLLKLTAGLTYPDRGTIKVLGNLPRKELRQKISFLPELNHLYKWMSVRETLNFFKSFYVDWDDEKARELVEFMHLKPQQKVSNLSKGMKARLKLIVTLARNASIILLDEPLSGIDPQSRGRIMDSLTSRFDFGNQTMIISTHDVLQAELIFDYVIFLEYGKIKRFAEADELRAEYGSSINDLLKEVFE